MDHYDLAPPLGLLSLAAVVREDGVQPTLVDFNLRVMQDPSLADENFYERAVRMIAETEPDVVGFTSMVVESHVCLELARRLKEQRPELVTVLGGPHFSAITEQVLTTYGWIDYVVAGEGERAFPDLMRKLRGAPDAPAELVNVAHRSEDGVVLRRTLKGMSGLDELPFPAYDLVDVEEYFALNPIRLLNVDHGRGCMFRCSFCYSPGHWGQGEQVKSANKVADEVKRMYEMGARHLFFVQDNLVNSVQVTKDLCEALTESGTGITWNAYATMQRLTPPLLDVLAAAGCTELFVGVDAITSKAQKSFAKHFYKGWESLRTRLTDCLERGIVPTCAFMIDPPLDGDHTATNEALTTALLARNLGCGIRLNTLTVYNSTATEQEFENVERSYTELKPRLLLDTPAMVYRNPYAQQDPSLYPFHSTVLPPAVYTRFVTGMHAAYTLFTSFPRTLLQYVMVDGGSLWQLLERVVDQVGDLIEIEPRLRRPLERKCFQELFGQLEVSSTVRDAFNLESAELRVSLSVHRPTVQVYSGGEHRIYRAEAHEVVRLHESLTDLARDDGAEPVESPGDYLVLREAGSIRYFQLTDEAVGELHRVQAATVDSGTVELSGEVLEELATVGVLSPVKEVV
ncbi:B12-binding domain-containing radical SAM protein [Kitasatospora brasiliensis]|uniref:B12-binding domain-containing radical SAM protein n=1 Tax=Kitasatospora brasiliensis TaxID=3058040 RepID=UPI002930BFE8|nr:cobalamin-dependent protein [Kitasatospora sp. K002]